MTLTLTLETKVWPRSEAFETSREIQTETRTLLVTLTDDAGNRGRGEACGVFYEGESPESMTAEIEPVRSVVEAGVDRQSLLDLLGPGGARAALDAALWDIEARQTGRSTFEMAGVSAKPVTTAVTIGIRSIEAYEEAARSRARYPLIKLKVDNRDPIAAIFAARRGAPDAGFIVDPNQAWSFDRLKHLAPALADLGVVLLEQPIPVGAEEGLDGYRCPVKLCADELINDMGDLIKAQGRFDVVNIKLDKTGGLTQALALANAASAMGFELMVGCMGGSSLSMAPAMVLAQSCTFADLDGPLLQAEDWSDGLIYQDGIIQPPTRSFWA